LISKGLIEELGRLETVGHPVLFGTTFDFLQYFGLDSLDRLPSLEIQENEDPYETEIEVVEDAHHSSQSSPAPEHE
jgi:segregation and condensation protein B